MDELNEDDLRKAMKEYEGIALSQDQRQRASIPDFCELTSQFFLNHLAEDTQILRSMDLLCRQIERDIYVKWIDEDVHIEFFEGEMTRTEIINDTPVIFLDRNSFFNALIIGIRAYLEYRELEDINGNKDE